MISLRAATTEHDADLTRIVFSLNSTFSDPFQSLLMSWWVESSVLDDGDSAGLLQDSFEYIFWIQFW